MTNHIHLLVRTPKPNLGAGLKAAHETFANFINEKYREHGHLFGQRFENKLVRDDAHLLGCFRYIARNPVDAGLCASPSDWRWSAHGALTGATPAPKLLHIDAALSFLDEEPTAARAEYLRLTTTDDMQLLSALMRQKSSAWLRSAVDDFAIPISTIAEYLGVSARTVYRRLAKVGVTEATGVA